MDEVLILGDVAGLDNTSTRFAAASIDLWAVGGNEFTLDALAFWPRDSGEGYDLWINGALAGSIGTVPLGEIARIVGLGYPVRHGKFTLSLRPKVGTARFRYAARSSTVLGYGLNMGPWVESPNITLPFELTLTRTRVGVPEWDPPAEVDPDGSGMSRVATILSRRERIPAYQANGVAGTGGEDTEPAIGQIWPR